MEVFADGSFDFILFSFNGIDYVGHEDRLKALREIKRVASKDAYLCLSTHNLNSVDGLATIDEHAAKELKQKKHVIIDDGALQSRLLTYYIKPTKQIKQLTKLGCKNIRIFSLADGSEIADRNSLDSLGDNWLYYLCNVG